jgi:hypothetical protein
MAIRRTAVSVVRPVSGNWGGHLDNGVICRSIIHVAGMALGVAEDYEDVRDWAFPKNAQD